MSRYLPQTLVEIRNISGFGDAKTEKYVDNFWISYLSIAEKEFFVTNT